MERDVEGEALGERLVATEAFAADRRDARPLAVRDEPCAEPPGERGHGLVGTARHDNRGAAERALLARAVAARPVRGHDRRGERRVDGFQCPMERGCGQGVVPAGLDDDRPADEAAERDRGQRQRRDVGGEHVADERRPVGCRPLRRPRAELVLDEREHRGRVDRGGAQANRFGDDGGR